MNPHNFQTHPGVLTMRSADKLQAGQTINIATYFFPKGQKVNDPVSFISEPLTVVEVNEERLKVRDRDGHIIYIPLEPYETHDGTTNSRIKSPVPGAHFEIWAHYPNLAESLFSRRMKAEG